jgi:orotidine-5'-phosphate decarboxylase
MGADSVEPFLSFDGKAVFVLARTSNPGGNDLQEQVTDGLPLYRRVARAALGWQAAGSGEVGLVVGATVPHAIKALRSDCPHTPFLVPGVGAQGGDARSVMSAGWNGPGSILINSSRAICYASNGADYESAASEAAKRAAASLRIDMTTDPE